VTPTTAISWELPPDRPSSRTPGLDKLIAIADVTGVSFEWLATGRGEMAADLRVGETAPPPIYSDDLLPLSADERQLLRRFRALSTAKKKAIIELIKE